MKRSQKEKEDRLQLKLGDFMNKKIKKDDQQVSSDLSKKSQDEKEDKKKQQQPKKILYNVQFYKNIRSSQPHGDYIQNMHKKWWGNYTLLQRHHGFIQWLFPNSFSSRFNSQAYALTQQQCTIFRNDLQIIHRYIRSYQMMLQFYGMKIKSKITGEITQCRNVDFRQRYNKTLLTSFHNHMRITRILCSLMMIGLGRYAKQLSLFLDYQIHSEKGNLRPLAKYNVDKDWKQYKNYIETEEDLNIYLKQAQKRAKIDKQHKYQQQMKKIYGEDVQKSQQLQKQKQQLKKQKK